MELCGSRIVDCHRIKVSKQFLFKLDKTIVRYTALDLMIKLVSENN